MVVVIIIVLNRFKNKVLNKYKMLKIILEFCLIDSLFYNTHHFENYYQLQFKEVYNILPNYVPVLTPFLLVLNTFGPTVIWYCINYLVYNSNRTKMIQHNSKKIQKYDIEYVHTKNMFTWMVTIT